jgi:cell division protein FtsN
MEVVVPEIEVVIPEQAIKGKAESGVKQVKQPGKYALQVGSFRGSEQADRFKAELVLQGFDVTVQTVTINNTDTYHRVRIGPFKDLDALNKARSHLNKQGIENKLIKITG